MRPLRSVSRCINDDFLPRAGTDIYFKRQLLHKSLQERRVDLMTLTAIPRGKELEQLPLDLPCSAEAGSTPKCPERPIIFISARVHPGETPGQFVFLGLLRFLLSDDPRACALRQRFVFKLVPMLNPDGVAMGHSICTVWGSQGVRVMRRRCSKHFDALFRASVLNSTSDHADVGGSRPLSDQQPGAQPEAQLKDRSFRLLDVGPHPINSPLGAIWRP